MATDDALSHVVVVAGSTTDAKALASILSPLGPDFPAPIILALRPATMDLSQLLSFLSSEVQLPIQVVEERETLAPATVYLVPPGQPSTVSVSTIAPRTTPDIIPSNPLTEIFAAAAESFGEGTIGIFLIGSGLEGVDAAYEVRKAGGAVIAQAPGVDGMHPLLLNLVDIVAPVATIGSLIADLLSGLFASSHATDQELLVNFLNSIRDRSGIDFHNYKISTIMRRLQRRMAATGETTLAGYVRYVREHPEEYQQLISSFLIKVTEFFRDPGLFAYLQSDILPAIIAAAEAGQREIRIWSAGCATGEEAYSLAILLTEILGSALERHRVRIFATDADADAVEFARRGIYPASAIKNVPPDLIERAFVEVDGEYEVNKRIRSLIIFGQHDLAERAPFPRIDLLLCRNVLIYFTADLQRRILQLFAFSVRDGGFLVLGKAETTGRLPEYFMLDNATYKVYRRQGERTLIPPIHTLETTPLTRSLSPRTATATRIRDVESPAGAGGDRVDRILIQLPVGVVMVDRRYDVRFINIAARRLLGIHGPITGEDLIHAVQTTPGTALRSQIDTVFRQHQSVTSETVAQSIDGSGERRFLSITCSLCPVQDGVTPDTVILTITDISPSAIRIQNLERALEQERADSTELRSQVETLTRTSAELLHANEQLATANAELRSGNEELMLGQEELQAAMEELETLNEELQATNEELETLNEELQATIEELNATNDDLQARTIELQEIAINLEQQQQLIELERARLELILSGMEDAVVVVDHNGQTVRANPAYAAIFARPDTVLVNVDGTPLSESETPRARAARGETFAAVYGVTGRDGTRWFLAHGQPIDAQGGVVILRSIPSPDAAQ